MITGKFRAADPDSINFTLSVTMPLKKWRELKEQMGDAYPAWEFRSKITDMIIQAEAGFYAEHESR